ncbi:hypothetical protein CR513_34901, partial [Mucuna pruriens]
MGSRDRGAILLLLRDLLLEARHHAPLYGLRAGGSLLVEHSSDPTSSQQLVAVGRTGPSVLFDESKDSLFPCIGLDNRPFWLRLTEMTWKIEDEFVKELSKLPTLSCSKLISNKGAFFSLCHSSRRGSSCCGFPFVRHMTGRGECFTTSSSPPPTATSLGDSLNKCAVEEGVLQSHERPSKKMAVGEGGVGGAADFNFAYPDLVPTNDAWASIMGSRPLSPSVWNPWYPIDEVVERSIGCFHDWERAKELGLPGSLEVLQRYAGYSLALSRAVELELGGLAA